MAPTLTQPAATPSLTRAAERIAVGLYVLAVVFVLGRQVVGNVVGAATPTPIATAAAIALPSAPLSTAAPAITATPSVVVTAAPTPSPQPTPDPLVVTAYENGGRRFAALAVPVGYTLTAPISGTVSVVVYQFLGGDVRIGSNIPSEPFYPYITITSVDRKVILRPGALDHATRALISLFPLKG